MCHILNTRFARSDPYLTGVPLAYTNWNTGEPNGGTGENCAAIMNTDPFEWKDFDCDGYKFVVCQSQKIPRPKQPAGEDFTF